MSQSATAATPAARPATRAEIIRTADSNFQKVDANGDRALNKAEIDAASVRQQQQASQNIANRMTQQFNRLDTDKNGQLSMAEFRAATPAPRPTANASTTAMQRLDANKDGKISIEEYRAPMLATFDRLDTNKNGTIDPAERAQAQARQRR